jgi:small nuclear ribonucleoprotein E
MNLVLDDAVEVRQVTKTNDTETRKPLGKALGPHIPGSILILAGQILLKGDNVSLIQSVSG